MEKSCMSHTCVRHTCTQDDPWTPDKGAAIHPDAYEVGSHRYYVALYWCPNCNLRFEEELPE